MIRIDDVVSFGLRSDIFLGGMGEEEHTENHFSSTGFFVLTGFFSFWVDTCHVHVLQRDTPERQ